MNLGDSWMPGTMIRKMEKGREWNWGGGKCRMSFISLHAIFPTVMYVGNWDEFGLH